MAPYGVTLTEQAHPGTFIIAELDEYMSRAKITIAPGNTIVPGQVLGRVNNALPTISVSVVKLFEPAFIGGGSLTLASPAFVAATVQPGAYLVTCITPAAGAGVFSVTDPLGAAMPNATAGVAYATQLDFTIAAAGTDFAAGDTFRVNVTVPNVAEAGQYAVLNNAGVNGAQVAQAVAIYPVVLDPVNPQVIAAIVFNAALRDVDLVWPTGTTLAQIATHLGELATQFVRVRTGSPAWPVGEAP